jgi:putative ABC transport system permease protein
MSWFAGLLIGLREIREHKFRSFLTMLGVILGVASLLAMFALTAGIATSWRTTMQQMGGLERVGINDKEVSLEFADMKALSPGRTLTDAEALRSASELISHVAPEMQAGGTLSAPDGETINARVLGTWPDHLAVQQHVVKRGRFITSLDEERGTRVVVLGDAMVAGLWPTEHDSGGDFIGRVITINGRPFSVVGVLERYEREEDKRRAAAQAAGKSTGRLALAGGGGGGGGGGRRDPFRWKNESVIVPLSTFYHEFRSGQTNAPPLSMAKIDGLNFRVRDIARFDEALAEAGGILQQTRRGIDDYDFDTREDWFERMETSLRATKLSGGLIAGISLLVGGIGIANIMLASIAQRVRELGVRLAVGARRRDVFLQILAESTVIGVVGGLLGLGAGVLLLQLLGLVAPLDSPPVIEWSAVAISVGFATSVGVLSGLYPAWCASRLDPISALRYE